MTREAEAPVLFLDFDGTVSDCDVIDAILERYADDRWLAFEQAWASGRLGSRDCLREQIALVRATPEEIDALLETVQIDDGFAPLLETCARHAIPVHIVSDGFDYCIERILGRAPAHVRGLIEAVQVRSSQLAPAARGRWRTRFPYFPVGCVHGCATCKPAAMQSLNPAGTPVLFVGDGLSDRYAAAAADLVFAKHKLAVYCDEQGMPHVRYSDLGAVAALIDEGMRERRPWRRLIAAPARA